MREECRESTNRSIFRHSTQWVILRKIRMRWWAVNVANRRAYSHSHSSINRLVNSRCKRLRWCSKSCHCPSLLRCANRTPTLRPSLRQRCQGTPIRRTYLISCRLSFRIEPSSSRITRVQSQTRLHSSATVKTFLRLHSITSLANCQSTT